MGCATAKALIFSILLSVISSGQTQEQPAFREQSNLVLVPALGSRTGEETSKEESSTDCEPPISLLKITVFLKTRA
jgi:hypothetical protein